MQASKSGGWGKTILNMLSGQTQMPTMQVEFPVAKVYTIEFNLQQLEESDVAIKCEALIQFGVEGNTVTRRVTVVNGMSISGNVQAVSVTLRDTTDQTDPTSLGKRYNVDITVAPGTRAFGHQPPILEQQSGVKLISPPPAAAVFFPVPSDCGAMSVFITALCPPGVGPPAAPGTIQVSHLDANNNVLKIYDPRQFPTWVPLSPGTSQIAVECTDSAAPSDAAFVTVTLGIDG